MLIPGCASAVRREITATKVGLAYSKSCFQLIAINPDYKTFHAHTRRIGPILPEDKANDGQVPNQADVSIIDEVGMREQVCERQEADAMQPTAPLVATALRNASVSRHVVFGQLAARQIVWAEARRKLWYIHDTTAIQLMPMLTELNENNRSRGR